MLAVVFAHAVSGMFQFPSPITLPPLHLSAEYSNTIQTPEIKGGYLGIGVLGGMRAGSHYFRRGDSEGQQLPTSAWERREAEPALCTGGSAHF